MGLVFFLRTFAVAAGMWVSLAAPEAVAEPRHGIAMYGEPALPPDFVALPEANPNAPKGGRLVMGNTGGFDSLNPFIQKGTTPWQLRFWVYESLMYRSWDEPFTLYGLLAESIEVPDDRSWVEFTLREEARFSDGSPVTVEDVIWSYETLGTEGHLRYRGFWTQVERIEQTGPRSVRLTFNTEDRELALLAGLRPILKKSEWEGRDFTRSGLDNSPIGTGPYVVDEAEGGRTLTFRRNPDYWGRDLPVRRGMQNFDELRIDFFGDGNVLFEAFKAGLLNAYRDYNAEHWARAYDFPAALRGDVVKTELASQKPSGMTGLVMNTRRTPLDDIRVREALILAFNFEFVSEAITGGTQPRIQSYFGNSILAMEPGPATGEVRALLEGLGDLPPGAMEGYALPVSDGTERNRANLRAAGRLLTEAGLAVENGRRLTPDGQPWELTAVIPLGDVETQTILDIYANALERLGIGLRIERVDSAQYATREARLDFDLAPFRRDLSLSPGNEQRLYWGSGEAGKEGTRNLMGVQSQAIDATIDTILSARSREGFVAAVKALDRLLTAGRYVIPIWQFDVDRIAHVRQLHHPGHIPIYGDRPGYLADFWWWEE